jgi:hypothetical protein
MLHINFGSTDKLNEYLNYKEVKYKKWECKERTYINQKGNPEHPIIVYPNSKVNNVLYKELTTNAEFKHLFEPVDFFRLLYNQFEFILSNIKAPAIIMEHLSGLDLEKLKLYFLLESLVYLICNINDTQYLIDPDFLIDDSYAKSERLENISLDISFKAKALRKELTIQQTPTKKILSPDQVALIYIYEKRNPITRENGTSIASSNGYLSEYSGEKFYQRYTFYSKKANRLAIPESTIKYNHKIELFESILDHLNSKANDWAIDELKLLKLRKAQKDESL